MIDYSKLVPYLIGAVKELTQQVEILTGATGDGTRIGGGMPTEADYYRNPYQYSREDYTTSTPEGDVQAVSYAPGWLPELLDLRQRVESGQASPWDREYYGMQAKAARSVPMRDPSTLTYNAGDECARPSQRGLT